MLKAGLCTVCLCLIKSSFRIDSDKLVQIYAWVLFFTDSMDST